MPVVRDDLGTYFHIPAKELQKYQPLDPTKAEEMIAEQKRIAEAKGDEVELQEMRPARVSAGGGEWYAGD